MVAVRANSMMSGADSHVQDPNLVIVVYNYDSGHQGAPGDEKVLPEPDATTGTTPSSSGSYAFNYLQGWRKVAVTTGYV